MPWVAGVAVILASLALVPVVGLPALVGLLAGAGIILVYALREMGSRTGPGPAGPGAYYTEGEDLDGSGGLLGEFGGDGGG